MPELLGQQVLAGAAGSAEAVGGRSSCAGMRQTATVSTTTGPFAGRSLDHGVVAEGVARASVSFHRQLRAPMGMSKRVLREPEEWRVVAQRVRSARNGSRGLGGAASLRPLGATEPSPGVGELQTMVERLGRLALGGTSGDADDATRIDAIAVLESVIAAASAARSRVEVEFYGSQIAAAESMGVPARRRGRGVADQIALARRIGPVTAARELANSHGLVTELPETFGRLARGEVGYRSAATIAARTGELSRSDRAAIDRELAPQLSSWSVRQVQAEADRAVYQADPQGAVDRAAKAAKDRHVSLRPAPDCMTRLSALLPVREGVSVLKHLEQAAAAARAGGDPRGRGQVMADTLVERVTGQARADDVDVEVGVVVTDEAWTGASEQPGEVERYGPVPAGLIRDWLHRTTGCGGTPSPHDSTSRSWLRRITRHPGHRTVNGLEHRRHRLTGELTALAGFGGDARARTVELHRLLGPIDKLDTGTPRSGDPEALPRTFTGALRRFVLTRDQHCRTPYCDAPIRHVDHIVPASRGGPTTAANGEGVCEHFNYVKDVPGWRVRTAPEGALRGTGPPDAVHEVEISTPTGHTYRSPAPPLLG